MRIDMDTCEEILVTITRNKTRSLLTAFGVFWGIFMLVALIGGGQGMQEQMKAQFEGFATNSGFIAAQKTSEAYKGFRKGRWWDLEMEDVERVRSIDGIKNGHSFICLMETDSRLRRKQIRMQRQRSIPRIRTDRTSGNDVRPLYQ